MSYTYDVFISYRDSRLVGPWVRDHFAPLIEMHVSEHLGRDAHLFVDRSTESGGSWRDIIGDALLRSRCMLAVWSKRYFFDSEWCPAELRSMMERDALCSRGRGHTVPSLIYPVVVNDGDDFPDDVRDLMYTADEMHDFLHSAAHFRLDPLYLHFEARIRAIAPAIARRVESAPGWQDWPLVSPVERPRGAPVGQPRLGEVR